MRTRNGDELTTHVANLAVEEEIQVDQQRVKEIVAELGEMAASNLIVAAMAQLSLALRQALRAAAQNDKAQIAAHADRLSKLAWQIGLVTLAGVAVDVGRCSESGDMQALSATLARLERVANRSLTEIWDSDLEP